MKKTFTQNDLIRLIYNEADPIEAIQIWNAMKMDYQLKEAYTEMLYIKEEMNKEASKPSKSSIEIILAHSKKTQPVNNWM